MRLACVLWNKRAGNEYCDEFVYGVNTLVSFFTLFFLFRYRYVEYPKCITHTHTYARVATKEKDVNQTRASTQPKENFTSHSYMHLYFG